MIEIGGRGISIIWGEAHIHIFVFTDCKNNRFQKKLMMHNTNIHICAPPPPFIDLSRPQHEVSTHLLVHVSIVLKFNSACVSSRKNV